MQNETPGGVTPGVRLQPQADYLAALTFSMNMSVGRVILTNPRASAVVSARRKEKAASLTLALPPLATTSWFAFSASSVSVALPLNSDSTWLAASDRLIRLGLGAGY